MGNDKQGDDGEDWGMSPYENYCNSMRERGLEPTMNEAQLHEAWGINEEVHTPFIASKNRHYNGIIPTLENHDPKKRSTKPQLKINLMDIPRSFEDIEEPIGNLEDSMEMESAPIVHETLIQELEKRIKAKKVKAKITPKPKAVRTPKPPSVLTRRPNQVEKMPIKHMTPDEKRKHKNRLNNERRARYKEEGILQSRTEEQKQRQREYSREYYKQNREIAREKERIRRANMSEEKKAEVKEAALKWQRENRERVNANAREWKKKNREARLAKKREYDLKKKEAINNTSLSQKVS